MRSQHNVSISELIDPSIPPQNIIDALHSHEPVIKAQAITTRWERIPVPLEDVVNDEFFVVEGSEIRAYLIYEKVTYIPGVYKKEISFPVIFQNVREGLRTRASAPAGIIIHSEYRVRKGEQGWELSADHIVESNSLILGMVSKQMEGAHRELLQKVLGEVAEKLNH